MRHYVISGATHTSQLSVEEQIEREDADLPPKIRPINSGSLITKVALAAALKTPSAQLAASKTLPFQLALGTKRGVELLITCQAAFGSGFMIGRNDFANGFNSMSRQDMLDSHALLFPEATEIFNFFYGAAAPVFLFDEHGDLRQLSSEQGSRQGCAAGTEAFCIALHKVLVKLQSLYPEYHFRVITDDIIPLIPPPATPTFDEWQKCYVRYAKFLADLRKYSRDLVGLSLNSDKAGLLYHLVHHYLLLRPKCCLILRSTSGPTVSALLAPLSAPMSLCATMLLSKLRKLLPKSTLLASLDARMLGHVIDCFSPVEPSYLIFSLPLCPPRSLCLICVSMTALFRKPSVTQLVSVHARESHSRHAQSFFAIAQRMRII